MTSSLSTMYNAYLQPRYQGSVRQRQNDAPARSNDTRTPPECERGSQAVPRGPRTRGLSAAFLADPGCAHHRHRRRRKVTTAPAPPLPSPQTGWEQLRARVWQRVRMSELLGTSRNGVIQRRKRLAPGHEVAAQPPSLGS
ncbi:unnamed protein product [Lampetra planeri]